MQTLGTISVICPSNNLRSLGRQSKRLEQARLC